jgi:hypothetical protein
MIDAIEAYFIADMELQKKKDRVVEKDIIDTIPFI